MVKGLCLFERRAFPCLHRPGAVSCAEVIGMNDITPLLSNTAVQHCHFRTSKSIHTLVAAGTGFIIADVNLWACFWNLGTVHHCVSTQRMATNFKLPETYVQVSRPCRRMWCLCMCHNYNKLAKTTVLLAHAPKLSRIPFQRLV